MKKELSRHIKFLRGTARLTIALIFVASMPSHAQDSISSKNLQQGATNLYI